MSRKAIGKTVSRMSRSEAKGGGILSEKKYRFLESVRFTNLTGIVLSGGEKATEFVEFTFADFKKFIRQQEKNSLAGSERLKERKASTEAELHSALEKLSKRDRALKKHKLIAEQQVEKVEALELALGVNKSRITELEAQLANEVESFSILKRNYDAVLRNIDEEDDGSKSMTPSPTRGWDTITSRKPLPGSYGTGKRR
jgi:Skp family chaperone for outer membrane proteins